MNKEKIIGIAAVILILLILVAIAIPSFIRARMTSCQNGCINNLRMIDSGKEQWALANHRTNGEEIVISGVNTYIRGNTTPTCPEGGTYIYNVIGADPECSGYSQMKHGPKVPHRLPK
jgi:competence protein ComGC